MEDPLLPRTDAGVAVQAVVALRMFLLIKRMLTLIEGRITQARALALEQYGHWINVSSSEALTYRGVQDFASKREQGRLESTIPAWSEFAAAYGERGAAPAAVAFALAMVGRVDEAAARLDISYGTRFTDIPDEAGWPMAVAMWVETALLVGAHDAAVLHSGSEHGDCIFRARRRVDAVFHRKAGEAGVAEKVQDA